MPTVKGMWTSLAISCHIHILAPPFVFSNLTVSCSHNTGISRTLSQYFTDWL